MQALGRVFRSKAVQEQEVKDPLPWVLERPSSQAKAACQLSAGEGVAESIWVPCDGRVQNYQGPVMGGKAEEVERGADLLEGPRPANTGAENPGGQRVFGIDDLVHFTSPPLTSQLSQAD